MGMFDFFTGKISDSKDSRTRDRSRVSGFSLSNNDDMKIPENNSNMAKVKVFHPKSFEDVEEIITHLRNRKPAIVYLNEIKEGTAQRVLDLLSGAIYALKGGLFEIEKGIFIFTPDGVEA